MRFYLGSDHAGVEMRRHLAQTLLETGHEVVAELGAKSDTDRVDYPDVAVDVCKKVAADPEAYGVLVCGTGQGMAMSANRIRGIRAAVCVDPYSAKMARAHNDANVLCLGGRVIGLGLASDVLTAFVQGEFEGGRHEQRVAKVNAI
jgi:ribose 5-phosphate isomerase B